MIHKTQKTFPHISPEPPITQIANKDYPVYAQPTGATEGNFTLICTAQEC